MSEDDEMKWLVKNVLVWLAIWLAGFVSGMVARGADMPVGQLQGITNLAPSDRIFAVRSNGAARLLTNWNAVLATRAQLADGTNSVVALVGVVSNDLRMQWASEIAAASNAVASVMVRNTNGVATNLTLAGERLKIFDFGFTNYPGAGVDIGTAGGVLMQSWSSGDGSVDQHGDFFYWGAITDSNHITTKAWVENAIGNAVSTATNGLAGTNLIYRVLAGTNMIAVTNGWDVTLSSTVSAGGEMTTNFSGINVTNQIWMPSPDARAVVVDGPGKKLSLFNSFTDMSNYEEGFLRWETNALKLGTAAAGTGTKRNIVLDGALSVFSGSTMTYSNSVLTVPSAVYVGNNNLNQYHAYVSQTVYGGRFASAIVSPDSNWFAAISTSNQKSGEPSRMVYLDLVNYSNANPSNETILAASTNKFIIVLGGVSRADGACDNTMTNFLPAMLMVNSGVHFITADKTNSTDSVFTINPRERTNWLGGSTTITNLASVSVNGQAGKSITNIWYSVGSDGTGIITNRQVFLNGILVSWQQNGSEL